MEKPDDKEFISDYEAQKMLGLTTPVNPPEEWYAADSSRRKRIAKIRNRVVGDSPRPDEVILEPLETGVRDAGDNLRLTNLMLDFDLIPYRNDNQVAHEVFEDPDVWSWIGILNFKRADVEALKTLPGWRSAEPTAPEHQLKHLEIRRDNILRLQQSRDQLALGPSKFLRDALAEIEKQMAAYRQLERSEMSALPTGRPKTSGGRFQVPSGTGWDEIEIILISDEEARIITPNNNCLVRYSDLGMAKRNNLKPAQSWVLLKIFAQFGSIDPGVNSGIESKNISKSVERLSIQLQTAFGIVERAFTDYRRTRRYSPKFRLIDKRDPNAIAARSEHDSVSVFDEEVTDKERYIDRARHIDDLG